MASFVERNGKWRALVRVNNMNSSKTFRTKGAARAWAKVEEARLAGKGAPTLNQAFHDYADKISPTKAGHLWELARLEKFELYFTKRYSAELTAVEVDQTHIATWRDWRMKSVRNGTVLREMTLLSSVFAVAWTEWRWINDNPCRGVKRPPAPKHRTKTFTDEEIALLCDAMGYEPGESITVGQRVATAFLLAIECGMRCGEICNLEPEDVSGNVLHIPKSKNGFPRDVPLSDRSISLLAQVGSNFRLTPRQVDSNFRKYRNRIKLEGLTFHDSRHTAVTRLSKRLNPYELSAMVGHKNLNELLTYYNEAASSIATRLND